MKLSIFIVFLFVSSLASHLRADELPTVVGHQTHEIEGWIVHIRDSLFETDSESTKRALELLRAQLQEIVRTVPERSLAELRKVPLWFSPEYPGVQARAEYHPGAGWLRDNQRNPAMEKAIEFTNIRVFEKETKRMPNFALHELAHAFHDRVLPDGFENRQLKTAFEKAKSKNLYDRVEQRFGDGRTAQVRAYALTNPMEYFAETTEAYFSTNDFFPFTRSQLQEYDPDMFALLQVLWAVPSSTDDVPTTVDDGNRPLSVERIFGSDEFQAERPPIFKWLSNGSYTLLRKTGNSKVAEIVQVDLDGTETVLVASNQLVPAGSSEPIEIHGYDFSKDLDLVLLYTNSVKVWRQNTRGDYWTLRRSTGKLTRLGETTSPSSLMFAKLSPDGSRVGYVRDNNLYVQPSGGGEPIALTKDGSNEVINGTFDWVYEEEFACRDGWRWSPDGSKIAFWQLDTTGVKKFTLIDNTSENYPILKSFAYPKTGEQNSNCRIGVITFDGTTLTWMDVPGDMRNDYYIPRMEWAGNSSELVIQRANRLQNAVDVMMIDVATGKPRTLITENDSTWVDIQDEAIDWTENGSTFTWISERDGWKQLYLVSRDGTRSRRALKANYDMIQMLHIDAFAKKCFFLASPDNPTQQYLYSADCGLESAPTRVTPQDQPGSHDYAISPDGAFAIHTYSAFGKPPRVSLVTLPDHKVLRVLASNSKLSKAVRDLSKGPSEFVRVNIGIDEPLDAWMMKPPGFDEQKKYPVIFHVYGEPASQSVKDRWGGNNYLWHLMLTQQGYVVVCIDNRGTPCPRGRAWRKAAYRRVGSLASQDQSAAAREILKRPFIDNSRVGVWGWSGGGSMTLNLLFRYPDLYHTGIAIASVPDMRLYDTIYQERYMGLPQVNTEDYRDGSPITHAAGLKGNLLIVHGTGDDNCHAQGMEKLTNRLIELNKPFSQMSYPNRSHSINEGKTTSLHLYSLMTRFFHQHLPSQTKP
jgi:dipeptidyl-peptidase-4